MASFDSHSFCARCREKGKGSDPCISHNDCTACNSLTEDQRIQLSTPSYRLKKEKRDLKKSSDTPAKDSSSSSLIDPSSVMVVGAVDAQGVIQSPGSSSDKKKKKPNPPEKKSSNQNPKSGKEKPSKSPTPQSHRSSSDTRIDELDLKWSERFNRLEALLLAKSLDKPEPTFASVKVTPTHSPPVGVVKSSEPFIRPADRSQPSDLSSTDHSPQRQSTDKSLTLSSKKQTSDLPGVTQIARKSQSTSKLPKDKPLTGQSTDLPGTGSPAHLQVSSKSTSAPAGRQSSASIDTDSDSDFSDQPAVDIFVEEGELSDPDQDAATNDPDQTLSEDQNYRETMRGIRSYMGWTHIPDMDTATSTSDDNPFAGPKTQPTGKVSVNMPVDEWLCKKMGKLNLTLVEGYPSRSSEAGGLLKDQFVRPARSQQKWYGFFDDQQKCTTAKTVSSWNTDASKVNSTYSRIAKAAGIASTPPASRQISQDSLRRWEKAAREASTFCNQAAAFNRCLNKVQDNMHSQLKTVKAELGKGKSSTRVSGAAGELQFLMDFNSGITQAMAKTLEHLTDFVFVTVANTTLARRDSYLSHLKAGIKPDTLASLRTAPLNLATLFPEDALKQAEQDIATFESKGQVQSGKKGRFHPYERTDRRSDSKKSERPAWKNVGYRGQSKKGRGKASYYSSRPAKGQQSYK